MTRWAVIPLFLTAACVAIPQGNAERGREVFLARDAGHCVLCHSAPGVAAAGDVGPPLSGVGARLDAKEIRARVADMGQVNPAALMPAFHRTEGLKRVAPQYRGKPVLSGEQLDDVVAYLVSLK